MQHFVYETESKIESTHWWFQTRRSMFAKYLQDFKKDVSILDVGSSSGTNLRMLKELGFTNYSGFDMSELSKKFCEEKQLGNVILGDICQTSLLDNQYDIILATDVIEHIDNDDLALQEIYRILKPEGKLIITVPCFMTLWNRHDVVSMHKRRYRLKEIKSKLSQAKMHVKESYYFNFFLFIPILFFRKITEILGIKIKSENAVNNRFFNTIFRLIFELDVFLARKIAFPFGVSAFIFAQKPRPHQTLSARQNDSQ